MPWNAPGHFIATEATKVYCGDKNAWGFDVVRTEPKGTIFKVIETTNWVFAGGYYGIIGNGTEKIYMDETLRPYVQHEHVQPSARTSSSGCKGGICKSFLGGSGVTYTQRARPPYVVAICGASCAGKSTIASQVSAELNDNPQAKPIRADDFFLFDQYRTDQCPLKRGGSCTWKNWESVDSMDWAAFLAEVQRQALAPDCPKYLVVEGFLNLATVESRALFDAAIDLRVSASECWRRRSSRARSMAHLPSGFSDGDEERNYEVLETYLPSWMDRAAIDKIAWKRHPDEGNLAWLRMYFDEVVWPAAEDEQVKMDSIKGLPVLRLDADTPKGKAEWQQKRFPEALVFLRKECP